MNDLRIDISQVAQAWITRVNSELQMLETMSPAESERWRKQSIYKIPAGSVTKNAVYTPQTVSIGPYHHGAEGLKGMEEHKHRALLRFLKRSERPLQSYVDTLAQAAEDLRDAYDRLGEEWKQDVEKFVTVMMVDGCFVLEILRQERDYTEMGYEKNDPVFSKHGRLCIVPYLKRDMLMLENQLPMQVLTTLLDLQKGVPDQYSQQKEVINLVLNFFGQDNNITDTGEYCFVHILAVYRKSLIHCSQPRNNISKLANKPRGADIVRSAEELKEAGIKIRASKSQSLTDISFERGVLRLPLIVVDDVLETQYLNMIAFERFHEGAGSEVTSYVFFMDSIIDSARDVVLLHSSGVVRSALGSDKAVANLFNSLSNDITLDPESSLGDVHRRVNNYCLKQCPKLKASLKHNYFTNPWAGISVVAAIFLFALTGAQTLYTVLGYYQDM